MNEERDRFKFLRGAFKTTLMCAVGSAVLQLINPQIDPFIIGCLTIMSPALFGLGYAVSPKQYAITGEQPPLFEEAKKASNLLRRPNNLNFALYTLAGFTMSPLVNAVIN
jgi:hypothetical protein